MWKKPQKEELIEKTPQEEEFVENNPQEEKSLGEVLDLDWGEGLDELDFPLNPESPRMAEEEENPSPFLGNVDEDIVEENLDESAKDVEKEIFHRKSRVRM